MTLKSRRRATTLLAGVFAASSLFASQLFPTHASAQDLLPADNGIYTYHESPRWRESEEHPLRILAYSTHWMGWVLREGVFRPISYFAGSTEFTRSFLGFREPFDYRESVCFATSGAIPNCQQVAPYTNIGRNSLTSMGDGDDTGMMDGQQVYFPDINFAFDKATLNGVGKGRVRQVAQLLSNVPEVSIVVEGHTDYKGSDEYNQSLGQRRAETVINELVSLGIDPARLSGVSYGESKPVFTEQEDWARAVNRRAQFSVGAPQGDVAMEDSAS